MSLILLLAMGAATLTTGCTYDRAPSKLVKPSYSNRQANAVLTVNQIWPVRDQRSARAPDIARLGEANR